MVKYLLLLFSCSPLYAASFFLEDQSVFVGIRIADDRLYLKSVWIHKSEIKSQEDIKSSGEVFQIKLFDGSILTGTVERKDNYINIGSNPVFKDSRKIMKADIVSMNEIKRIQVKTYLGYILIGVIEQENDEVVQITNIYNPEGYILKSKTQADSDIKYTIQSYTENVKGRQFYRPWRQYSFYGYVNYTYSQDETIKAYLPFVFGGSAGVIRGADDWFRMKERHWYIPVLGSFMSVQYYNTNTAYFINSTVTAGTYWKARTFWNTTIHFGVSPGLSFIRIQDATAKNSLNFVQMFSVLVDIKIYRQFSLALRADESMIFEAGRVLLYPYFSAGVKYEI